MSRVQITISTSGTAGFFPAPFVFPSPGRLFCFDFRPCLLKIFSRGRFSRHSHCRFQASRPPRFPGAAPTKLGNIPNLREKLSAYVSFGGTLLVMAQPVDTCYKLLPDKVESIGCYLLPGQGLLHGHGRHPEIHPGPGWSERCHRGRDGRRGPHFLARGGRDLALPAQEQLPGAPRVPARRRPGDRFQLLQRLRPRSCAVTPR